MADDYLDASLIYTHEWYIVAEHHYDLQDALL